MILFHSFQNMDFRLFWLYWAPMASSVQEPQVNKELLRKEDPEVALAENCAEQNPTLTPS